jgi:hypothetical protein
MGGGLSCAQWARASPSGCCRQSGSQDNQRQQKHNQQSNQLARTGVTSHGLHRCGLPVMVGRSAALSASMLVSAERIECDRGQPIR